MINQKLTAFVCLAGLAFVVSQAAELPPANSIAPASSFASIQVQPTIGSSGEEMDEEFMFEDSDGDEYADDFEEDEESLEEELSDLAEEHYMVREDCKSLKSMIDESKQSGNLTVDTELLQAYEGCQKDLQDIRAEMQSLTQQIMVAA